MTHGLPPEVTWGLLSEVACGPLFGMIQRFPFKQSMGSYLRSSIDPLVVIWELLPEVTHGLLCEVSYGLPPTMTQRPEVTLSWCDLGTSLGDLKSLPKMTYRLPPEVTCGLSLS